METNNILEVKNLSVLIKERFLVKGVSFSLKKGQTLAIIGEDKSGKTSLIKAIDGALPISQGQIFVDGKNIMTNREVLSEIAISLDPPMFFKFQSVYENLKYLTSLSNKFDKKKIEETLKIFNLHDKLSTKVLHLSYFERKLLSISLAFITEPKLVLLDQPFKSLPESQIDQLKDYIKMLKKKGTSIIITSSKFEEVEKDCDCFIFMNDRKLIRSFQKEEGEYLTDLKTYAFVEVKYPHYIGKSISEEFGLDVKLLGKKVLFEANEDLTAEIVKFFTLKKIAIYKAGYLNKKMEQILANLASFYKKEDNR